MYYEVDLRSRKTGDSIECILSTQNNDEAYEFASQWNIKNVHDYNPETMNYDDLFDKKSDGLFADVYETEDQDRHIINEKENVKMSKLEKDERGFWHYTSVNGIVYDVDIPSGEINVITDVFQDFWDMFDDSNVAIGLPEWKFIDYVCGEIEREPDEIKDWFDSRIDFYEKHERTLKFCAGDDKFRKVYLGTEESREWRDGERISIDEMKKMLRKDKKLSEDEAVQFWSWVWCGHKNEHYKEIAKEIADKFYELKFDEKFNWMNIRKLENEEDYQKEWENNNWYVYFTMDELIQDEWERGYDQEMYTIGDCAKELYEEIDHTIFKLNHCVIQYYN